MSSKGATDHNLLPEIRAYMAKARLRRGIEMVKLANRIESLKMQEDEEEDTPQDADVPAHAKEAAGEQLASGTITTTGLDTNSTASGMSAAFGVPAAAGGLQVPEQTLSKKKSLTKLAKGAIFREVVLAKVREMKADEESKKVTGL